MKMIFVLKDKTEREVDFVSGDTVLQTGNNNNIPLHGSCEGFGVCGSCHVIVENCFDKLQEISDREHDALDRATGVTAKSRLACQMVLNESLDGLKVKLL